MVPFKRMIFFQKKCETIHLVKNVCDFSLTPLYSVPRAWLIQFAPDMVWREFSSSVYLQHSVLVALIICGFSPSLTAKPQDESCTDTVAMAVTSLITAAVIQHGTRAYLQVITATTSQSCLINSLVSLTSTQQGWKDFSRRYYVEAKLLHRENNLLNIMKRKKKSKVESLSSCFDRSRQNCAAFLSS